LNALKEIQLNKHFRILPSLRFEYYLVALREAEFIIGNSSSGVREAPYFGVPSINLGSRQKGRAEAGTIINSEFSRVGIEAAIKLVSKVKRSRTSNFGDGKAGERFIATLSNPAIWQDPVQKHFIDFES
jgi:UDP-N-acetylglucosamine 2-epimerase (hydrolysing)